MSAGMLSGILGNEGEMPEVAASEPLAGAEAFAAAVAAKLAGNDPEVARDTSAFPKKQAMFVRKDDTRDQPYPVVVDPRIAFGRLAGRSVPSAVLSDRFKAGETLTQLAEDYDTSPQNVEESLRCEFECKAA